MSTPAAGPWTKYAQQQPAEGPWTKYKPTPTPAVTQLEKDAQPTLTSAYNPNAEKYGPVVRALDAAGGAVLSAPGAIASTVAHPINAAKGLGQSIGAWFDPKTRPTLEGIKSVLPEALGTGIGNAAVGEATPKLAKIGADATEGARTSIGGAIRNGSELKPGIKSTAQTVGAVTGGAPGALHGNIEGALVGGYAGAKAGPAILSRVFPEPPSNVGASLPSYEDYALNRGNELNKMRAMDEAAQRRQAKIAPPTVDTPGGFGAPLPSAEEFYENRGAELNKIRKMQPQESPTEAEKPTFVGAPLPSADEFYSHRGAELNAMRKQQPEAFTPQKIEPPSFPGASLPSTDEFYENRGAELNKIRSMNEALNSKQAAAEPATPRIAAPSDAGPRFTGSEGRAATWTNDRVQQLARQGDRTAIQQMVRRGMELPENARYVAGDPNFSAGVYNPRDVTVFSPDGTPIRQGGKQLSRISTGESRPEPEPRWAYRAHDEGNPDFDLSRNSPHATLSPEEAAEYRESRGNQEGAKPQTVSRTNLNLVPDQFEELQGPRGNPWIKFRQQQKWEPYKP